MRNSDLQPESPRPAFGRRALVLAILSFAAAAMPLAATTHSRSESVTKGAVLRRVRIEKTAFVQFPLCPGGTIRYRVELTNLSNPELGAERAAIVDPVPAATAYVEGSVTGAVYDAASGQIVWDGLLEPGQGHVIEFSVTLTAIPAGRRVINAAAGQLATLAVDVVLPLPLGETEEGEVFECAVEEPLRPLVVIPGSMGTVLVATDTFSGFHAGDELWPARKLGTNVPTPDQETYSFLGFNLAGNPRYPKIGLPARANVELPAFDLTFNPMVDKAGDIPIYSGTIEFLEQNGYAFGRTLFAFGWDWREGAGEKDAAGNYVNANRLDRFINRVLERYRQEPGAEEVGEVDILAHSQGGYVAWLYVGTHKNAARKVAHLVTVGTPYLGSPKAAASMLYGVNYGKFLGFDELGVKVGVNVGPGPEVVQKISQYMPGVAELLPPQEGRWFFNDPHGHLGFGRGLLNNNTVRALMQKQLTNIVPVAQADRVRRDLHAIWRTPPGGIDYTVIAGSGKASWGTIQVKDKEDVTGQRNLNGDETVPTGSHLAISLLNNAVPRYLTRDQEHLASFQGGPSMHIALNVLRNLDPLKGGAGGFVVPRGEGRQVQVPAPAWQGFPFNPVETIELRSPLDLLLSDTLGSSTGVSEDGLHLEEIPGSALEHMGLGRTQSILVPPDGAYNLDLRSFADGEETFDLALAQRDADGVTDLTAFLDVPVGPATRGHLSLGVGAPVLRIDYDGDGDFDSDRHADLEGSQDLDGDGLIDGAEVFYYGTDPTLADTDGDGRSDGEEVRAGDSNPLRPDPLDIDTALDLTGGRFRVEIEWQDFQGQAGKARAVPLHSADSGLFWFFSPDNWEVLVKVLDGCQLNERFWVFAAATTNVEYTLRVTDLESGQVQEYHNPLGRAAAAVTDTEAFATCGESDKAAGGSTAATFRAAEPVGTVVASPPPEPTAAAVDGGCNAGPSVLCLNDERFAVEVEWRDFRGQRGKARLVPLRSADSGLFWFFSPDNWEILVKVLDGCRLNRRFWVFAAATTNVEYTMRVTDTATGEVQEYFNPLGLASAAITDTAAFATCR